MHCFLCGKYINPNYTQRVVNPQGKLVSACPDGRECRYRDKSVKKIIGAVKYRSRYKFKGR